MSQSNFVEVPERAAVIGASLLKKNAASYYRKNLTASADHLQAYARQLCEETDVEWKELDDVELMGDDQ